jgi:hypothetical protein
MGFYTASFFTACLTYLTLILTLTNTVFRDWLPVVIFDGSLLIGYLSLEALREILNLKSIWQTVKTILEVKNLPCKRKARKRRR